MLTSRVTGFTIGLIVGACLSSIAGATREATALSARVGTAAPSQGDTVERLFRDDQADSRPYATLRDRTQTDARARRRAVAVRTLLGRDQIAGRDQLFMAAMVLQHSPDVDDHVTAHVLATASAFDGHREARWLSAASLDALLLDLDRRQVLGTIYGPQFRQYDRSLPDRIREHYCVPTLATQLENVARLELVGRRAFQRFANSCEPR